MIPPYHLRDHPADPVTEGPAQWLSASLPAPKGLSISRGTGHNRVRVCKCAQKLTLKSSGVVVEWCGALKTPGESMERDREVWPVDEGGWQPQVGGDDPKKVRMCVKIENVNEILLKIRVAA